jgi:hypothetical protein
MSIFGSIMGAIFGKGSAQAGASPTAAPSAPPAQTVDVAAIVDKAAAAKGEKLAWRTSIVDLMKALDLDSSLSARKQVAKELHYTALVASFIMICLCNQTFILAESLVLPAVLSQLPTAGG